MRICDNISVPSEVFSVFISRTMIHAQILGVPIFYPRVFAPLHYKKWQCPRRETRDDVVTWTGGLGGMRLLTKRTDYRRPGSRNGRRTGPRFNQTNYGDGGGACAFFLTRVARPAPPSSAQAHNLAHLHLAFCPLIVTHCDL